jgi:hypothetical protein
MFMFILFVSYVKTCDVNCDIERTELMTVFPALTVRCRRNNGICLVVTSLSILSFFPPHVVVSNMSVIITSSDNAKYYVIALKNEGAYGKERTKK